MKTLGSKIAYVEKWLKEGRKLTDMQARNNWNYTRLASGIHRLRERFNDKWIINVGEPGKYANYLMLVRGKYARYLVKGYRFKVEYCWYVYDEYDNYKDTDILLTADNGIKKVELRVNQDAFRSKKIMENKLKEALK